MPSLGQQERDRAFEECLAYIREHTRFPLTTAWVRRLRIAFDAGVELRLRGCCHAHPDNGSNLAVKERDA